MKQESVDGKGSVRRKMPLPLLAATLILISFIGYLLYINFRSHNALVSSSLRSFQLDMEKQSALMGYFFIERKYDIRALAGAKEITSYYTNKHMGMSERYGLRLNLFLIGNLLHRIIGEKYIENDPVYQRIALADVGGKILVNAGGGSSPLPVIRRQTSSGEPVYHVQNDGSSTSVMLSMPVFFRSRTVGHIIAELKLDTLYRHFMGSHGTNALRGFILTDDQGAPICTEHRQYCALFDEQPSLHPTAGGSDEFPYFSAGQKTSDDLLVKRMAIPSSPLYLTAWAHHREIYGPVAPWQIYLASAFFAAVVLAGVGLLIRFSIKNSLLHARYEAAARQHHLLESKNRQLHKEMRLREAAERALESQKSLRIRSDRLRSLGELAAGIAHELNQPLAGIRGLSELIQFSLRNGPLEIDKIVEFAGRITEQTDRMAHIISHVRLFAREAGSKNVACVDLNATIASALSLLSTQFTSHGLIIRKKMDPSSLVVEANPYSLEEVIINIMNNARHAVESRREALGNGFKPVITIQTRHAGESDGTGRAVLEISDNGPGVPRKIAGRIFDPFFTTKAPDKGTGLGLSICKSIVESFGGRIDFTSAEGAGTTFVVSFACIPGTRQRSAAPETAVFQNP